MTGPLYAIGRFCARHHWPTIAIWIAVAVALILAGQAGESKTNDNLTLPGTGSTLATELLEDKLPEQAFGSNPLVFQAKAGEVLTAPKYKSAIDESVKRLNALHDVNSAVNPLTPQGAAFLSKDRSVAYSPVILGVGPSELTEAQALAVLDAGKPAEAAGLNVSIGAYVGSQLSKPDTGASDAIGIAAAIVILLFAFGTATAMVLPIVVSDPRPRLLALDHPPARARDPGAERRLDPGDDDRARRRHRLRALHRHPPQAAARRRDGDPGVGRPRHGNRRRRRRLRRLHRRDRALLARRRRHPAGHHTRLHRRDRGGDRGPRRGDAAAGDAGRARPAHQLAARAVRQDAPRRSRAARLATLGPRRRKSPLALRPRRPRGPDRAGDSDLLQLELGQNDISALPKSTTARQAYDGLTQGFGPGVNGPLLIASEFESPEEAKQVLPLLEKKINAAHDVAGVSEPSLDKDRHGGRLHGHLQIGPLGG